MLVIVDEREIVTSGYASRFVSEGVASASFRPDDFRDWVATVGDNDIDAVEAFLLGDCHERSHYPRMIRERSRAPLIAMNDAPCLEQTLDLFAAGVDDVVRKPIHVREILARVGAIRRRREKDADYVSIGDLRVFADGRDPELHGRTLALPRRERRILEYLVENRGRRVTKSQIFNSIYGIYDENVEENVVESHISKLRKKLRRQLGYDPIDSVRYLGYRLEGAV
ncbi:response regulator transcription factor [Methylocella sp.]|uniref:response regulator transcription factor n=1 Tax=Methylocella sp. TaxID=1978226 RepID=UPI0035B2733A